MKIILDSFTQIVPESNVANADFTRTNNTQSLADANRDVVQTKYSLTALIFGWEKVTCIAQKQ